jgi:plasmid stability protein
MREIVIKNLDDAAIERLERRAAANGWSLEEEIHHILTEGVLFMEKAGGVLQGMKSTLKNTQPPPQRDANKVREAEEFFKRLRSEERP